MSKADIKLAIKANVNMIGFVFFGPSPRSLTIDKASQLMENIPNNILKIALTVNADDALLSQIARHTTVDLFQLHGSEDPERLIQIKERYKLGTIKVIPISNSSDLKNISDFDHISDYIMFDAKPPLGTSRPGGNAISFDWQLLKDIQCDAPWILAGGLTSRNVKKAIKVSGAKMVDVSSGVERSPGVKDPNRINAFVKSIKEL